MHTAVGVLPREACATGKCMRSPNHPDHCARFMSTRPPTIGVPSSCNNRVATPSWQDGGVPSAYTTRCH